MALDPKKIKSVEDQGHVFVVHHADQGVFPVAKKGLRPETVKQIQAFCHGGHVQAMAEGGEVEEAPAEGVAEEPPSPFAPFGPSTNPWLIPARQAGVVQVEPPLQIPSIAGQGTVLAPNPGQGTVLAPQQDFTAYTPPEPSAQAATAETPTPAPASAPAPRPAVGDGSGRAFDRVANAEAEALQEKAEMERQRLEAQAQMQAASNERQTKMYEAAQAQMQANLERQTRLSDEIANGNVEADRFWDSRTTGQKVSATIGMILGGIGAGLTGGPNQALQVIENAIARDVETQKANLGKKSSLLSMYVQQGHDIQDAMKLAAAHEMAAVEGQLRAADSKYSALETAPNTKALIAQMRAKYTQLGQEAQERSLNNAIKREQLGAAQAERALKGDQLALAPLKREAEVWLSQGKGIPADRAWLVDPKRAIKLDDGLIYQANTDDDAKEIKEAQAAAQRLKDAAMQIKSFRHQHSGGVLFPGAAASAGKALQEEAMTAIADLSKKLRLNADGRAQLEQTIINPANETTVDRTVLGQMDALVDRANRYVNAELRARLPNGGGRGSSSGLTVRRAGE